MEKVGRGKGEEIGEDWKRMALMTVGRRLDCGGAF